MHRSVKICFATLSATFLLASSAAAQGSPPEGSGPRDVLLADLGLHVIGIGVQHTFVPWLAGQIAMDLYVPWTQEGHVFDGSKKPRVDVAGNVIRGRLFFYPFRGSPSGLWVSPFGQVGAVVSQQGPQSTAGGAAALGLSAGYSLLLKKHLHVAIGIGAQYHVVNIPGAGVLASFATFAPTADLNVGYAF